MGGSSNNISMDNKATGQDREYWLNCLAEYELALEEEFVMQEGKGFNDNMIQMLKFEIERMYKTTSLERSDITSIVGAVANDYDGQVAIVPATKRGMSNTTTSSGSW